MPAVAPGPLATTKAPLPPAPGPRPPAPCPRPPAWLGVATVVAAALLGGALGWLGVDPTFFSLPCLIVMALGTTESSRACSGWRLARATRKHGVVVERGLLAPILLHLPGRAGTASMAQVLFAATNDLVWRVSLPRRDGCEFSVSHRRFWSPSQIIIDAGPFDAKFVVESFDDQGTVAMCLGPAVRLALQRLFAQTSARRVHFGVGAVEVDFPRRGHDVKPVLCALAVMQALAEAIDVPVTNVPIALLRAHSPGGNSTGF